MSDLEKYIDQRKKTDIDFALDYEEGFADFKLGETLKQMRKDAGLSQEELASLLHTHKPAISRMENHAEDLLMSTLFKVAHACGKRIDIKFLDESRG